MARCQPEHKLILVSAMMESQLHTFGNAVRDLEKDHIHIAPDVDAIKKDCLSGSLSRAKWRFGVISQSCERSCARPGS